MVKCVNLITTRLFGAGYWILTPLVRNNGELIWVNRGFVPFELKDPGTRNNSGDETVSVTGLLRASEPKGTILQSNDPQSGRWYSRDVEAFSRATGLPAPAPYFIDAGPGEDAQGRPRGGLTNIAFRNNHLVYALTWYAMALMLAGGVAYVLYLSARPQEDADD